MTEQEKQENQKTIIAFAAGLLIGGLLVWIFGGAPKTNEKAEQTMATNTEQTTAQVATGTPTTEPTASKPVATVKPTMKTGDGKIEVSDQKAGTTVKLDSATFPSDEGWIGVRDYANGQPTGLLGVVRFSKEQGLIPQDVILQRATKAGETYAVVFYSENGDRTFSLATDVQVGGVFATFTAK